MMTFPDDLNRTNRHLYRVILRYSDFALFRPSCSDEHRVSRCTAGLFSEGRTYYFRGIKRVHRRLWWDVWKDTTEVWAPESAMEFHVLTEREALAVADLGRGTLMSIAHWAQKAHDPVDDPISLPRPSMRIRKYHREYEGAGESP